MRCFSSPIGILEHSPAGRPAGPRIVWDSVGDMAIVTRTLGGTGAEVTILGYGAMELRGRPRGPQIADQDAGRLLNAVLDGGINLIDTSPDYGRSEELIGSCIGHRRDEFFLASKCGCPLVVPAGALPPYQHDYSPGNVRADVEQSLRRLRTDYLDLVQVHMSPARATLEEDGTVETLKGLQAEGKVRFIGMSGILPNLPDHIAMGVFDVFQIPYSAVQRDHEELITEAAGAGAGTVIRGGAARGAASQDKNWRTGPLSQDPGVGQRNWETSGLADLLSEAGMSNMEFVLRFTLSHSGLSTTIVGTANPVHLASNIAVAERGPLPADLYEEAKKRLPLPDARYGISST
jgi:aryl-alcohol dehydrogenase-like predicted oxidoreductase